MRNFMNIGYKQKWLKPGLEVSSYSFPVKEWRAYAIIKECRSIDSQISGKNMFKKNLEHH